MDKDPAETTISIDFDTKTYLYWTNQKPTIRLCVKDFSEYIEVSQDELSLLLMELYSMSLGKLSYINT